MKNNSKLSIPELTNIVDKNEANRKIIKR